MGAYTGSASPYGTFDQGGNVWEWNEQIVSGSGRGMRGGTDYNDSSDFAVSVWSSGVPTDAGDDVGFRVASLVPEPDASPLALIVLAGLAAQQQRRRRAR